MQVNAENAIVRDSILTVARTGALSVEDSAVGVAVAQGAHLQNSAAGVVVGQRVDTHNTRTLVLIGRQIHGDVETVLDPRGALLLGLGLGAAAGIVSFLLGLIRRTDRPKSLRE